MHTCIYCRKRTVPEEVIHSFAALCICVRCCAMSEAGGIPITPEMAEMIFKQAIRNAPQPEPTAGIAPVFSTVDDIRASNCVHCGYAVDSDDVYLSFRSRPGCVCVRCARTAMGVQQEMPRALRLAVSQVVNDMANT